jgi:hypothetical protein
MELKRNFTGINERARRVLGITRDEYAYCSYVLYRQADTRQKKRGWCCDPKEELAEFVGITRPGLYKMTDRMIKAGLLEVDEPTGFLCATPYFIDIENECKQSLQSEANKGQDAVNLVYTDCKLSLHENGNGVNLVTPIIGKEGYNKKEEERKPHQAKPDTVKPASFQSLDTQEQMRAVWKYSNKQLAEIPSMKITQTEKDEKVKKYQHVMVALRSEQFRALIEQYKAYRKTNKKIKAGAKWYDSEVRLCACIAELALLSGMKNGKIDDANARRIYEQTFEKGYIGFFALRNQPPATPNPVEAPMHRSKLRSLNSIADFS